jgi:hypothetical protein
MDFAIYVEFPNPSGDELCVLGTEVKNEDLFCHAQRYTGQWDWKKVIGKFSEDYFAGGRFTLKDLKILKLED